MRLLRAAERATVAWKNGGGTTAEVAAFPPGAGMDDFEWRVSVAEVAAPGPFSRFDGVDRVLTVLEGCLSLRFFTGGGRRVVLNPGEPFAFAGDVAVEGTPIGGPVRDLNVMVRRGVWRTQVELWRPGMSVAGTRIAFATTRSAGLDAHDALLLESGDAPPGDFSGNIVRFDRLP